VAVEEALDGPIVPHLNLEELVVSHRGFRRPAVAGHAELCDHVLDFLQGEDPAVVGLSLPRVLVAR
jgi:hypothetical protein